MGSTTVFVVALTTARMIMPGMPAMDKIPGMRDMSAPTRTITMTLTSDKKADAKSKAECAIPSGLKLGPKVDLLIDLPQKSDETGPGVGDKEGPGKTAEFHLKNYWGCSETVIPGQPKTTDTKEMSAAMQKAMSSKDFNASFSRTLNATMDGSHAYWPGADSPEIAKDATCPGQYDLTTNYCGDTSITFGNPQDFLAAIELVSPGKTVEVEKAIKVEWKPVPNAVGYLLSAFSGKEGEMITWTSASTPNPPVEIQTKALTKEQVEKYIKDGILLPANATYCYIPAGIFKDTGKPMLTVTAFGSDKLQVKDEIETNVIIRSNVMVMLGGMGMITGADGEDPNEDAKDASGDGKDPGKDTDKPAVNKDKPADGSGDVVGDTNKTLDKVDDVNNVLKRAKKIFKKR